MLSFGFSALCLHVIAMSPSAGAGTAYAGMRVSLMRLFTTNGFTDLLYECSKFVLYYIQA